MTDEQTLVDAYQEALDLAVYCSDERQRIVRLRDLGGWLPTREWSEATWSECVDCGLPLYGPLTDEEATYDGEPLVCLDAKCGLVHRMRADEAGWAVMASDDMSGRWVYLRESARLGLVRLMGGLDARSA